LQHDFFWLVGLLEGEGSFMHGPPSTPNQPRLVLHMTDLDIVERAARLMGTRCVPRKHSNPRWKPTFATMLRGRRAARLMQEMYPHLGSRRRAQIDRALSDYVDREPGNPRKLTDQEVRNIRTSSLNPNELGKRFKVARNTIIKILSGRIHKHVA